MRDSADALDPPVFPGLYLAQVQKVGDNGELQVSIPAIFDKEAPEEFVRARPCFPAGHYFVPDPGAKVWVAFEHGDLAAPVWLGVWYPPGSTPLGDDSPTPPVQRVILSSKKHVVLLDDTDGAERVKISDHAGNSIELSGTAVTITCKQDLTINASGKNVVIQAASVDIKKG